MKKSREDVIAAAIAWEQNPSEVELETLRVAVQAYLKDRSRPDENLVVHMTGTKARLRDGSVLRIVRSGEKAFLVRELSSQPGLARG